MLGQERRAVHLVGEQDVVAERLLEREAALEVLRLAGLYPAVEPGEDDLDGVVERPGLGEDRRERRPAPGGGADRLVQPGLAERARAGRSARPLPAHSIVTSSSMAGRARRSPSEKASGRETRPPTMSSKPAGVDRGNVVVREQVVQPGRGDRVAERLERHPVVAGGQLKLDLAEGLHGVGRYTVERSGL